MSAVPLLAATDAPTLSAFGRDPWWLLVAKTLFVFVFLVASTLVMIWAERRVVARMQQRLGPNRVGPMGLGQGLADGVKLALKEDIIPALADRPVYLLAPVISAIPAVLAFAVIPLGPTVSVFGHRTPLQLTDLPVAVLFVLACSSFGVYGLVLAGWSSGSTYPLLGGLRSAAQVISYEVSLSLALVAVFIYSGSLSTSQIVDAQHGLWYVVPLFVSFVIYAISAVGETNRAPFDLPEAEGELVGGFHTEYSSLKFAMFFLAEYINMTTVSAVATTLFLGGWRPFPIPGISGLVGWWGPLWFAIKLFALLFGFIWLRGTLPRLRYDQFMKFGWKRLIPTSLVWILIVAAVRTVSLEGIDRRTVLIYVGIPVVVVLVAIAIWPQSTPATDEAAGGGDSTDDVLEPPRFPVPALPGYDGDGAPPAAGSSTRRDVPSA